MNLLKFLENDKNLEEVVPNAVDLLNTTLRVQSNYNYYLYLIREISLFSNDELVTSLKKKKRLH